MDGLREAAGREAALCGGAADGGETMCLGPRTVCRTVTRGGRRRLAVSRGRSGGALAVLPPVRSGRTWQARGAWAGLLAGPGGPAGACAGAGRRGPADWGETV